MRLDPARLSIFHITDETNLPSILEAGGLHPDARMKGNSYTSIGYDHIKERRLTKPVPCCNNQPVGEFVPFYFCPRAPMLFTINKGNTGRPTGCQATILHLVSTVAVGIGLKRAWAISDGNTSASYTEFHATLTALDTLDWSAIKATSWQGRQNQKSAEFLVEGFFPWSAVLAIGCHNSDVATRVQTLLKSYKHQPHVTVQRAWYY